ncbi:16S rRNA (cytosine(1402)-N(4))-methyltransferase RsmH [Blattabacterium cuenoti]|uniref:16S rRNA (cytosine(1402)-N(4))-methyltransferase RsmH n=1 Tax=Blattabacterium cuenoti TaxID=1653831 RepID=UPI00163D3168|nr:16S rRNA (cytosine(1402)-N(4))-methyltransferase RsmH [Blattabacterium cuenoti]
MKYYHQPVLLKESVENFLTDKNGVYIDATFGGGGHSSYILENLDEKAMLIAFDQDKEAVMKNCIKDPRLHLFHANFIHVNEILKKKNIKQVTGILLDLGYSSFQIDNPSRGFSNRYDCILDMRMNQENIYSAQDIINNYSKRKLSKIFKEYGDFKNASRIADRIMKKRNKKRIITSFDLMNIFYINGSFSKRKRFFSRLFQSIRIEVNDEINILKSFLLKSSTILLKGGRIAVISYHSIEDRIAKLFFKIKNQDIPFRMIHKKVIKPKIKEIKTNSRSRSAKLRIAEII